MNGTPQTSAGQQGMPAGAPLTRPQRAELLRLLLLGRGLERALVSLRRRSAARSGHHEGALAAIAAAAALGEGDRLTAPHGLLAAHLATGAGPAAVASARLGEPAAAGHGASGLLAGIGPQSAVGIAAGHAFALARTGVAGSAVALVDRRWAEDDGCRGGLALARELGLPLVVVAIDCGETADGGTGTIDRRDFEAIRAAVAAGIAGTREQRGPALLAVAPAGEGVPTGPQGARFRTRVEDPVADFERRLKVQGFARAELEAAHQAVTAELREALGGRFAPAGGTAANGSRG